jgi:hypothetical protein
MRIRVLLRPVLYALALDLVLVLAIILERSRLAPWMWEQGDADASVAGPVTSALLLPLLLLSRITPSIMDSLVTAIVGYTVLFTVFFAVVFRKKRSVASAGSRENSPDDQ